MSTYGWPDCTPILVDGYSLSGTGSAGTLELTLPGFVRVTEEATVAGVSWEAHLLTGEKKAKQSAQVKVFYDDTLTTGTKAALTTQGASRVLSFGFEGGTVGTSFAGGIGHATEIDTPVAKGALDKIIAPFLITGQYDPHGVVLKAVSAVTADGNSQAASVDNAALTSNGGAAYFHVTNLTLGTATSLTLKVMHSSDNVTFAALCTSTAYTTAPIGEQVTSSGTVNRYLAGLWDYGGSPDGTTTATIFIGYARR